MSIVRSRIKTFNVPDKEYFELWFKYGSLGGAMEALKNAGHINPKTGNPPTRMTIRNRAVTWVANHPEEAFPYYQQAGSKQTYEQFLKWLTRYVYKTISCEGKVPKRYFKWAKKMDLEKYVPETFREGKEYENLDEVMGDISDLKEMLDEAIAR